MLHGLDYFFFHVREVFDYRLFKDFLDLFLFCACTHAHSFLSCPTLTLWTVAHQASLFMIFSRQEYWSGLLCPPPGDPPDPGTECMSPLSSALQALFYPLSHLFRAREAPSSSGNHIIQMLVCLILSQRSLMLSSIIFILFPFFYSSAVFSTTLSSNSLTHTPALYILLLIPSRILLISVTVLFVSVLYFF